MNITELTVHELIEKLDKNELTIKDINTAYRDRIKEIDPKIQAFVTDLSDNAVEEAGKISRESKFAGIPIGIKDNLCTKGIKTTCSSKMLENFVSPYNATVIEKINEEKMPMLGKLNMDEFAMGSSTENSAFMKTKNPWDLTRVPGGSSGGSAAAVASNMVPWALGSDTGGSIRQPASLCGIVGLKPTYGLVSRYGLVAFASSLDQIGPMTKDVTDNAMLLKIGVPKEYFGDGINDEVKEKLKIAIEKYRELGAIVEECDFDTADYAVATYYIISFAEASSNLGRFDGIRYGHRTSNFKTLKDIYMNSRSEGFGEEVKRRILLGTYVLSSGYYDAYYKKGQQVRTLIKNKFDELFKKYDILLTPTSPTTAFEIGEKSNNPLEMYLADICTVSINIAGVPAMSIPCGVDSKGLPIGMQLIGKHFDEETIYRVAYTYEQNTNFRAQYKPMV